MHLTQKIENREAVVGIDVDGRKVEALNRQESYIEDITSETLAGLERPSALW